MSSHSQLQTFFDKLEELRAVFILSRRSLPSLEELFRFVQDTALLLEEVDASIRARTGDMPRAALQLKSVTEATELATTEILDLADEVLEKLRAIDQHPAALSKHVDALEAADTCTLALLREELGPEHEALLARVEALCEEKNTLRQAVRGEKQSVHEALAGVRTSINRITMSLQVQDITSQQLASVNHLIEAVRERMDQLLTRIRPAESLSGAAGAEPPPSSRLAVEASTQEPLTFDEKASYDHAPSRQQMADDLVASFNGDGGAETPDAPATPAPFSEPAPSTTENDAQEAASQEAGSQESASQADIDQLFQQGL